LYEPKDLEYDPDPAAWIPSDFFLADGPVSVQLSSTIDPAGNLLVYFGTGRFISEADKSDTAQQYLYCVKDPFYNVTKYESSYYADFSHTLTLETPDLFNAASVLSTTEGRVTGLSGGDMDFWDFVAKIRRERNGWYLKLDTSNAGASERIITQISILGGMAVVPVFTPSIDVCGMGGESGFIGVYYETGTGYKQQLFDIDSSNLRYVTITVDGQTKTAEVVEIRDDGKWHGMPAPKSPFHGGLESGARISTQVGTGEFVNIQVDPALYYKSITTEWWDDPDQATALDPQCDW
jgi:Tfp pilus tip-associated adhesin PilY1